uniref:uncharacterized protein LOC105353059 n=1 Tax=Fragaria vesca subsp. vesca TaxID=101020 RepID=UPI0005C9CA49|nr:PREDICTED: uncharacterized protein LOC105353059 [Fragaria vesca subsp. vesca]
MANPLQSLVDHHVNLGTVCEGNVSLENHDALRYAIDLFETDMEGTLENLRNAWRVRDSDAAKRTLLEIQVTAFGFGGDCKVSQEALQLSNEVQNWNGHQAFWTAARLEDFEQTLGVLTGFVEQLKELLPEEEEAEEDEQFERSSDEEDRFGGSSDEDNQALQESMNRINAVFLNIFNVDQLPKNPPAC